MLSGDAAMSTLLPFKCHDLLLSICNEAMMGIFDNNKIQEMKLYCIEFAQLISFSQNHQCTAFAVNFARCLIDKIREVHGNNQPVPNVACIPNSYNPSTGTAYYFTESGEQLREMPKYEVFEGNKRYNACYDDRPEVDGPCNKLLPKVSRVGTGTCSCGSALFMGIVMAPTLLLVGRDAKIHFHHCTNIVKPCQKT